ncbi:MAG: Lrp/AsnC ligand binding domain-containing protein [Desulfurococcales archaeon]|jgi:2-isopropylmalate synthase|nr:Lrp/AsnC ligand binding domain-containing protein [Desulfurococcales archaeon]
MAEVLVFIVVDPGRLDSVGRALKNIAGVKEVMSITGEYDLVVRVEAKDIETALRVVKDSILPIQGIRKTITSVIVEKY